MEELRKEVDINLKDFEAEKMVEVEETAIRLSESVQKGEIIQEPIKIVVTEYQCNVYADEKTRQQAPEQSIVNISGRLELSEKKKDGHLLEQVYKNIMKGESFKDWKKC